MFGVECDGSFAKIPAQFGFAVWCQHFVARIDLSPCLLAPLAPAGCLHSHGYTIVVEVGKFCHTVSSFSSWEVRAAAAAKRSYHAHSGANLGDSLQLLEDCFLFPT